MPSRRQHLKSRHGCLTCKARKVKCDFQRPACGHCVRRRERCRYSEVAPRLSKDGLHLTCARNFSGSTNRQCNNPIYNSIPTTEHLLLQHFSSSVSLTLSDRQDFRAVWSHHVPNDSKNHPYLMHSMLAISALHLSLTASRKDSLESSFFVAKAKSHQTMALSLLSSRVTRVTVEDFDAMYATAMLIFLFHVGLIPSSRSPRPLNDIQSLSALGRGILAVRREGQERCEIKQSYLIREYHRWDHQPPLPQKLSQIMLNLEGLLASLPESETNAGNKFEYQHAVTFLRMTFDAVNSNPQHPAMMFMWFSLLSPRFIELINAEDTIALLILEHYGISLLHSHVKWWAANCGVYIVRAVRQILYNAAMVQS